MLGLPPPVLDEELVFRGVWEEGLIVGEAKFDNFLRLIHQTAAYARAVFSHQRDRLWVYAIMLLRPNAMVFARYDRSGLVMSPEFDISLQGGRMNIAKGLCALMMLNDVQFGIDRTISGDDIVVGDVVYCIVETLCYRECVRGRGTRVYVLEPKAEGFPITISPMDTGESDVAIMSPPILRRSARLKKEEQKVEAVASIPTTVRRCRIYIRHFSLTSRIGENCPFRASQGAAEGTSTSKFRNGEQKMYIKGVMGCQEL